MTHQDLVRRAERWLRGTMRCSVVIAERVSYANEVPDAIGWTSKGSILVECKTSRSDFFADGKKFFRQNPEYGMGDFRFYMVPRGLINADEVPERWGLLEARPKQVRVILDAYSFDKVRASFKERTLLVSALRRFQNPES
jgi:hypothetical protein